MAGPSRTHLPKMRRKIHPAEHRILTRMTAPTNSAAKTAPARAIVVSDACYRHELRMKIDCSKEANWGDFLSICLGLMFAGNLLAILHLAAHDKGFLGAMLWICGMAYGRFSKR